MAGPHQGQRVVTTGAPLRDAKGAVVMVHGRGASPESILTLVPALRRPEFAYLAPEAAGGAWYPDSFMAPIPRNEPGITSGMQAVADVLAIVQAQGISLGRTVLLGFSQGACLALEYAARNARRYGGVAALSGGLIGPDGTPRDYAGAMDGTPVFLGCSDVDFHIPRERVEESAEVMRGLGADVTLRLYRGMGHQVNEDEVAHVQAMLDAIPARD